MRKRLAAALGAALLVTPPESGAQVFTPTFQAPVTSSDIGVYLVDFGDLAVEGVLRQRFGRVSDIGLRVGFAEQNDENALLLGVDFRSPLQPSGTAPLALAVTLGAQAALLDADAWGVQGGLSLGYAFRSPEVSVTPYIHPRLAFRDLGGTDNLDLLADLGIDLGVTPDVDIRFGANLGEGADWGIGVAFRR
jgi:hypothetical protein